MQKKTIYTTPQDAENAFYSAIHRGDIEAFMAVWSEDEEILCILPGGPRIIGYNDIRETWRHILENDQRFGIRVDHQVVLSGALVTVHNLQVTVTLTNDQGVQRVPVLATNIFSRGPSGWRLMVHHASPIMSNDEDETGDGDRTLH